MRGWKTHQAKSRTKRKTTLGLLALGLLISLILIYQLVNFVRFLTAPLNQSKRVSTWDSQFSVNLVINSKPISIFNYSPSEKKITILTIPDETYIDVPGGFGEWQASSIYGLAKSSNLSGEKLMEDTFSSYLGIPIDGFSSLDLVNYLRGGPFSGFGILGKIQTDLTPLELLQLKMGISGVRFDKINRLDLVSLGVLDKEKLLDGTDVYMTDPIRLDSVLSDFQDSKIREEHLSVAIFNATDKPQLAQRAKRLITNLGGDVVAAQNAPRTITKTYVQVSEEGQNSKTYKRLNQIFNLGCQENKCDKISLDELGAASLRAQIIVVLGEDFP